LTKRFHANGKFLLTGEYAVLAGVRALALPLRLQQHMEVTSTDTGEMHWRSYDADEELWLDLRFAMESLQKGPTVETDQNLSKLLEMLGTAKTLNPDFNWETGYKVTTTLDFNRSWGMGTSSTIISMLAEWIGCDAYKLQFACFGGSSYDIACAKADGPIIYQNNGVQIKSDRLGFAPSIASELFFVYLNRKQNSRRSIASFNPSRLDHQIRNDLDRMPELFQNAVDDLRAFEELIEQHEKLIGSLIDVQPIREAQFQDFPGAIKSLGGWGGDFVLATGGPENRQYFMDRGYHTILEWTDIVL
jgi:mevalonate kinase